VSWARDIPCVDLVCGACQEAFTWNVGTDESDTHMPIALDLDDESLVAGSARELNEATKPLLRLQRRYGRECEVLAAVPCRRCGRGDQIWVEATWDRGLIVSCRALACKPELVRAYAFQWGPFGQRNAIFQCGPSPRDATRTVYVIGNDVSDSLTEPDRRRHVRSCGSPKRLNCGEVRPRRPVRRLDQRASPSDE
jgi:hypothetical protein